MNIEQEREAFKKHYGALFDLTETPDAWGNPRFAHESVEAIWYGWRGRAALQSQDREDAERFRKIMNMTRAEREEVLFFPEDKDVIKAIDHARRIEGSGE